jgi:hypothetical protein
MYVTLPKDEGNGCLVGGARELDYTIKKEKERIPSHGPATVIDYI